MYICIYIPKTSPLFINRIEGLNCLKAVEPLRGDSLLLTAKSTGVPGTHFINFGRKMEG